MNKRLLLFVTKLFLAAAMKHAFGQGGAATSLDPVWEDPTQDVAAVMVAAPIGGAIFGAFRLLRTNSARPVLLSLRLG
ncbi:MAG TPA: hypothetical protein VI488_08075 [Candidatus Angelobacter sp.]